VAGALVVSVGAGVGISTWWLGKYAIAIRGLRTGVGDTTFYTADGKPWFRMDELRRDVPLSQIAKPLRQAVVAIEDHRFYGHFGIDLIGVSRAVFENVRGDGLQGGSTITQQLARTLFLTNKRTWNRKAKEAALALLLEAQLSKDQILELYLNRVYLSSGVYGVEPLSRRLYGKPSSDVTLAEAAMIAGLIRAPSALSPWSNYEGALERSRVVLARMRDERYITAAAATEAKRLRPRIRSYDVAIDARSGYVKEYLRQEFRNQFGGDHPPDWQVRTTVQPEVQQAAERAVVNGLARVRIRNLQAALVAIDPQTGDVLAMVGGRNFRETPYNRATKSRRQPGSAFKPFVFAAALERGWSPASVLTGLQSIPPVGEDEWVPRNAHAEVPDRLTLREALLDSNNRAAVALQNEIGSRAVLRLAHDAGFGELPDVPSLALGSGLVTPLEMARAYAVFPNGGFAITPHAIVRVIDADGDIAFEPLANRRKVLSPESAFQALTMLQDVVERGTGESARNWGVRFPAGGKTGTTNEFKDAWFVGFSSSVVAAVWVGFDQPATIGREAYGARLALPIWAEFMRTTSRRLVPAKFTAPRTLRPLALCKVSYLLPVDGCETYVEWMKPSDKDPDRLCDVHQGSWKQKAERVIEGFWDAIKRKVFGRKP
jgi:penicillin-binding protein 1A